MSEPRRFAQYRHAGGNVFVNEFDETDVHECGGARACTQRVRFGGKVMCAISGATLQCDYEDDDDDLDDGAVDDTEAPPLEPDDQAISEPIRPIAPRRKRRRVPASSAAAEPGREDTNRRRRCEALLPKLLAQNADKLSPADRAAVVDTCMRVHEWLGGKTATDVDALCLSVAYLMSREGGMPAAGIPHLAALSGALPALRRVHALCGVKQKHVTRCITQITERGAVAAI